MYASRVKRDRERELIPTERKLQKGRKVLIARRNNILFFFYFQEAPAIDRSPFGTDNFSAGLHFNPVLFARAVGHISL